MRFPSARAPHPLARSWYVRRLILRPAPCCWDQSVSLAATTKSMARISEKAVGGLVLAGSRLGSKNMVRKTSCSGSYFERALSEHQLKRTKGNGAIYPQLELRYATHREYFGVR